MNIDLQMDPDRLLNRLRIEHDQQVEARRAGKPYQEPLPFEDGFLDGPEEAIEYHGTSVGLRLHVEAEEPPCGPCAAFLDELVDADMAQPVKEA